MVDSGPIFGQRWARDRYTELSVDRNAATETQTPKYRGGRGPGRDPKEKNQKPQKPKGTQGPCPDLRGFCIKALTVLPAPGRNMLHKSREANTGDRFSDDPDVVYVWAATQIRLGLI